MTTKVEFNVFALVRQLEAMNHSRITNLDIAEATGRHRHTIAKVMAGDPENETLVMLGRLLDYFAAEGMPVTIADLFTVSDSDK